MLETMLKMNAASAKQDLFSEAHRPPPPPQGQGIVRLHSWLPSQVYLLTFLRVVSWLHRPSRASTRS